MIAAERTALVLLAAGSSRRFGTADKLSAQWLGRPVGLHVVTALAEVPFQMRIAVVGATTLDFAAHGFTVIRNPDAASGMAGSVRLGVARARAGGAQAVVTALADMPCVTAGHIRRLLAAADGDDAVVGSSDGATRKPPALFGRGRFDVLLTLDGEHGARDLIRAGTPVASGPGELVDIDTADDLARLRASGPIRATAPIGG